MQKNDNVKIKLLSGCNVDMSKEVYNNHYCKFSESQFSSFNNFINAGLYFPQIMQFVFVVVAILNGNTSWSDIILCNLINGVLFTSMWFFLRLYKVPGLSYVSCLIGSLIFRVFLHFVGIALISFFVVKDWKVLLFCVVGGIITEIITSMLWAFLSNAKYHDEVVRYVSAFNSEEKVFDDESEKYAKILVDQTGELIDMGDARQFVNLLQLYSLSGKKAVLDAFDEFSENILEKYDITSSNFVISFFIGALNANSVISQSEMENMRKEFISKHVFSIEEEVKKNKNYKANPDTPIKARKYMDTISKEWGNVINNINDGIESSIENGLNKKTDLLLEAIDWTNDFFSESKNDANYKIGADNLDAIYLLRIYLDCILTYNGDFDTINELYIKSKTSGLIDNSTHRFINLMIKINDLLDRAIVYLYENIDTVTTDYYPIVEQKIRKYLIEYVDDDSDWNKIF